MPRKRLTDEEITANKMKINNNYMAQLDDIKLRVPKGYREKIKEAANKAGKSVNEYMISALNTAYGLDIPFKTEQLSVEEKERVRKEGDIALTERQQKRQDKSGTESPDSNS